MMNMSIKHYQLPVVKIYLLCNYIFFIKIFSFLIFFVLKHENNINKSN